MAFCLLAFTIQACKKSGLTVVSGQITATKLTLKLNQPDTLILGGAAGDSVLWSFSPAGSSTLLQAKNKGIVKFNKAGTYTVNASATGGISASIVLTVTNDTYVPNPIYTLVPLNPAEQITLTPYFYKSTDGTTARMYFIAQTNKTYPCDNSSIQIGKDVNGHNLSLYFLGILQPDPGNCHFTPTTLSSQNIYYFDLGSVLSFTAGTYPFTVTLNNVTYTGSIVISGNNMAFNWNYTSGVIIAPKNLTLNL